MPGQALDDIALARDPIDPFSRPLSSFEPEVSTAPLIQGTKRKASNMENVEPSRSPSQLHPPIKVEPSSPSHFDYRADFMGNRPEHHEPTRYVGSLRSDDIEDQFLEIHPNQGTTTTTGLIRTPPTAVVQRNPSSREVSVPSEQESDIHTASVASQNNHREVDGLLRPLPVLDDPSPPCRQKASGRTQNARPSTGSKSEDVDYNSIPDYSPPVSTLPRGSPHILQVNWGKIPFVDLSKDPDRHMLHEAELELVKTLGLSCAKYLCTKRRIFQARVKAFQAGREFKKRDSQKACRINAGKSSKLCGVFEKVGWFDKKHFLEHLKDSNSPSRKANKDNNHNGSPSGIIGPNIWHVSDSEFSFTSEEDEESTDDDTADSSVSSDRRHDQTAERRSQNSYQDSLLWQQNRGLSVTEGEESQRRGLIDGTFQAHDTQPGDEALDKDRRSRRGTLLRERLDPRTSEGLPEDDAEEVPVLETRSMTQKIRLVLNNHSGDKADAFSTIKPKSSRQESSLKKLHRRVAIPHSLDEANTADSMLVEMKEKGYLWHEIEEAWEKKSGKAHNVGALSGRYSRIMANLASTGLQPDRERNSDYSFTQPRLEADDNQRLLAAEAEIEDKFQCEKADIIAEMESNFQSEKWNLVAEAMSCTGSVRFSAELIQAQYEKLTRDPKRSDAKEEENHETIDLPRRTSRAIKRKRAETSSPSRSGEGRLDEASNLTSLPQPQHVRLFLYQKRPDSKSQAFKSTSGQKSSADRATSGQKPSADTGHQKVRKDKSQSCAEQSARSIRAWAKRRALGTNGRNGGPPKAKKAKIAVPKAAPKAGIPLAPTATYQSGHSPEILPHQIAPRVIEGEVRRDANQHKQSLAQIIPAAPQTGSRQECIKPSKKHVAKRHTCRSCGMSYRHKPEHYRVLPNIGSEHRRRLAANKAAAESHSGPSITALGGQNITDISMG